MKSIVPAMLAAITATSLLAVDIRDTRLLTDPAVSADHIAFAYANDLWVASLDGSNVRRLTSHPGVESGPRFSPDGSMIAFTGRYEGNTDVYVVPTAGGIPKRLTWHPNNDIALGFTPDGSSVLFSSPREVYTRRYLQLFIVPVVGGSVTRLPIPNGTKATFSPDGRKIVYQPIGDPFLQWKHYRGGQNARLLIFDTATNAVEKIPQPAGRCNDTDPMWLGDKIYFRSDRAGEFNLFSYDPKTKQVEQLTRFAEWPMLNANAGGGRIIFERAGYLSLFDPQTRKDARLKIGVAADLVETRARFVKGAKYIRWGTLSPSGARAVFDYRGEIITVPMEKGDDRNLSQSAAANDRFPVWSPDGKSIAWFTDESGEYALRIAPQEGHGAGRDIKLDGAGFYRDPKWSPDGTKISYVDNSSSLYVLDVPSGASTKISTNPMYQSGLDHNWSPDSKWLAYTRNTSQYMDTVQLYSVDQKKSFAVGDDLADVSDPVFDPNGKYLYFIASTNAGPTSDWFSMWNNSAASTNSIYMVVLAKGVPSPLAKESDEEGKKSDDSTSDEKKKDDTAKSDEKKPPVKVVVDLDGLGQRIQALPVGEAVYSNIQLTKSGELYYLKRSGTFNRFTGDDPRNLQHYSLSKRKEESAVEKVNDYDLSRDGKRLLLAMPDNAWSIADVGEKIAPLTEPGVDVKAGEYLLAVEGKDLKYPDNLYARFERTAGRIVEITVGPNPDGSGSRIVKVVPIEDEAALRNRDWVERNLRYVTEKTQGRVAYVYVPNTTTLGHEYFTRYFFPQANRQAIIVDERHNGGGQVADYYLDILRRPFIRYWAMRYGADLKTPMASIQGPKVMIIDETAGSGGDLLPWMFHKLNMGTLVGRRTWGGLVGILGFPVLMDGGTITAPNLAIWDPQGGWVVENEGVPPDIEVEQTPADVIAGRDPQLDKAIEVALKQLDENPQPTPKRPPYPVRVM